MGVKQPFDFDWSQVEFGVMKLTDMTPNPDNPRTITADQLSTLRKSLTDGPRNLLLNPIKIDSNNVILGGNQRHTGLLELGYIEAPFIKAGPKFTQDEIRQFIVMDNVPAGAWNIPTLFDQYEWEELSEWGVDVPMPDQLDEMIEGEILDIPKSLQVMPKKEYILIMADEDSADWEELKQIFHCGIVRQGGCKVGSRSDKVGTGLERVFDLQTFKQRVLNGI